MLNSEDNGYNKRYSVNGRYNSTPDIDNVDIIDDDDHPTIKERVKSWARNRCSKRYLYKRLPILTWLPKYNVDTAVGDLVAGLSVGLTIIPQSMAYASLAGFPSYNGLYTSFVGAWLYIILGSSKDVPIGPTAIVSLVSGQAVGDRGYRHAIVLCFMTGIVQLLLGFLGLGFLIDFISRPVLSGFTSAAALIILTSQIKALLALTFPTSTFLQMWIDLFSTIEQSSWPDVVVGVCTIVALLCLKFLQTTKIGPAPEDGTPTLFHRITNKVLWLIGTVRNAILLIIGGFVGFAFSQGDATPPFRVTGDIPVGLPNVQPPPFTYTEIYNETTSIYHDFGSILYDLNTGLAIVPLLGLLENISICKAFGGGKSVDATQETLALGVCNVATSFFQGFPTAGALARAAVANSSGVRTVFHGFYVGLIVVFALLILTPYFYFVPIATLSGIIIAAIIFMVEYHVIVPIWKTKKKDLIPGLITFIACLVLPLEFGVIIGIGINLLFILYHAARPKIRMEKVATPDGLEYLVVTPDRCLYFPCIEYVKKLITKKSENESIPVIIDCSYIYSVDYTTATVIQVLVKDFTTRNQPLYFYNPKRTVTCVLESLSKNMIVCCDKNELDDLLRRQNKENDITTIS